MHALRTYAMRLNSNMYFVVSITRAIDIDTYFFATSDTAVAFPTNRCSFSKAQAQHTSFSHTG